MSWAGKKTSVTRGRALGDRLHGRHVGARGRRRSGSDYSDYSDSGSSSGSDYEPDHERQRKHRSHHSSHHHGANTRGRMGTDRRHAQISSVIEKTIPEADAEPLCRVINDGGPLPLPYVPEHGIVRFRLVFTSTSAPIVDHKKMIQVHVDDLLASYGDVDKNRAGYHLVMLGADVVAADTHRLTKPLRVTLETKSVTGAGNVTWSNCHYYSSDLCSDGVVLLPNQVVRTPLTMFLADEGVADNFRDIFTFGHSTAAHIKIADEDRMLKNERKTGRKPSSQHSYQITSTQTAPDDAIGYWYAQNVGTLINTNTNVMNSRGGLVLKVEKAPFFEALGTKYEVLGIENRCANVKDGFYLACDATSDDFSVVVEVTAVVLSGRTH